MHIRPIEDADLAQLAELITKEAPPAQPVCSPEMIRATLKRQANVDQGYYDDLVRTEILVCEESGTLVGAIAWGPTRHGVTDILWIAGEGRPDALALMISKVVGESRGPLRAYWYGTTISAALEGLPVGTRPNTHAALLQAGFAGEDLWSYQVLHRPTDGSTAIQETPTEPVSEKVVVDGVVVGEFEVGVCSEDRSLGELWWMEVYPEHQGRGYGRLVLDRALLTLEKLGVSTVHLVVDDDDPLSRDRRPAKHLYREAGFKEVDRLWSYHLGDLPTEAK